MYGYISLNYKDNNQVNSSENWGMILFVGLYIWGTAHTTLTIVQISPPLQSDSGQALIKGRQACVRHGAV